MNEFKSTYNFSNTFLMNKFKVYIRSSIGYCIYLYITAGGDGIVRELVLDKLSSLNKSINHGFQIDWKLEGKIFDILADFTLNLKQIPHSAFFQVNVCLLDKVLART